ncbi:MAG: HNH endonuclease [Bacteroidota bacterium]
MITLGEFSIEEVLPYTGCRAYSRVFSVGNNFWKVKMQSQRYQIFKEKGLICVCCGIVGAKFLLQMHENDKSPHFNLYAEKDGELILMTKDHIIPKSKGGSNHFSNLQPMCSLCNHLKDNSLKGQ